MRRKVTTALAALALVLTACGGDAERPETIRLMTHDSFAISEDVLDEFAAQSGVTVEIFEAGDAGQALNQAILTKGNPLADVLFGVDNTFLSRALENDIFVPYRSPVLDRVPAEFQLDPENRVTPIDFGDVCLNYDKEAFGAEGPPVPSELRDLTKPEYREMLIVEDPGTSSPGLVFLLATIAKFGESGDYTWQDFWTDLRANDVTVTSGWEEAYYGVFSGGSGEGDRPLVVSYASSPPAEVFFAEQPPAEAPTGVIVDGCFRQIEFAGILAGTDAEEVGGELIDFMLSRRFQEDIPLNMFVFPANRDAALPSVFVEHTTIPEAPLTVDPVLIEQNRERWIEEWTSIVLR
ncbi:MAG: thiamine ABC transporter substrate binding subunit [Acidimicrobiia bacterium]